MWRTFVALMCCRPSKTTDNDDERPLGNISVFDKPFTALFDSGAQISLISSIAWDSFEDYRKPGLSRYGAKVTGASGSQLKVRGEVIVKLQIGPRKTYRPFVVIEGLKHDVIIGADIMSAENIILDVGAKRIKVRSKPGTKSGLAKATQSHTIDSYAEQWIPVTIPKELQDQDLLITATSPTGVAVDGVYDFRRKKPQRVKIFNKSDSPLSIEVGEPVAECHMLKTGSYDLLDADDAAFASALRRPRQSLDGSSGSDSDICTLVTKPRTKKIDYQVLNDRLSAVPHQHKGSYSSLLSGFADLFASDPDEVGSCTEIRQDIRLKDENKIACVPPYRMPHHLAPLARAYVQKLLAADIIRPSRSPFCSPLMLVKKPGFTDSSKPLAEQYRVVHDFRMVNSNTIRDSYPLRHLYELIDEVSQGKVFSVIDLSQGYFQQHLTERSKKYTAFGVPGMGLFEYNRAAQGLCNSPAAFQRLLDYVTRGIQGCYVYLDDVVIVSKTHEDHLKILKEVLNRFRKYNLRVRLSKLQLAASEINYLGYNISVQHGIRPGAIKTEAIRKWTPPTDVKQVRQFLGLCSFFRKTIPNFSQIASPLTKLTRKDSPWKKGPLSSQALDSFQQLQAKLSQRPCLKPVDFNKEFIVTVDSSQQGVGAILTQVHDGQEHPCAYASRTLNDAERKLPPTHLEAVGLLWSVKHFHPYLIGKHFTLRTDHRPLLSLNTMHGTALNRIYSELQEFLPYTLEYLPGDKMPADGLSRQVASTSTDWDLQITDSELYSLQCADKYIKAAVCYLKFRALPSSPQLREYVKGIAEDLVLSHGIAGIKWKGRTLTLAPLALRPNLLTLAHDCRLAGHLGADKTLRRLQESWYWPGMKAEVLNYCRSCDICQQVNAANNNKPAPLDKLPSVTRFNERIHVDLLGPLPTTFHGNKYVLAMVDAFSSYTELVPIPNKQAETVAQAFIDGWIANHSVCSKVVSDLGSEFMAEIFQELCRKLGIETRQASRQNPKANGMVERANRSILDYIRKFIDTNQRWDELLPTLKYALNTAPHAVKHYSPFHIAFVRRPTLSSSIRSPLHTYSDQQTLQRYKLMGALWEDVARLRQEGELNQKREFDKHARVRSFEPGQVVYVSRPHKGNLFQKFQPKYEGPYIIQEIRPHNNLIIKRSNGKGKTLQLHKDRVKLAPKREQLYEDVNTSPKHKDDFVRDRDMDDEVIQQLQQGQRQGQDEDDEVAAGEPDDDPEEDSSSSSGSSPARESSSSPSPPPPPVRPRRAPPRPPPPPPPRLTRRQAHARGVNIPDDILHQYPAR